MDLKQENQKAASPLNSACVSMDVAQPRGMIEREIKNMRRNCDRWETILNMLPAKPTREQNDALLELIPMIR